MNRTLAATLTLLAFALNAPATHAQSHDVYYGDGNDGAITRSSSASETGSIIQATTYTVNSGVTMTCGGSSGAGIFVLATVSIDIQGTLNCDGRGSVGGAAGATGGVGWAAGGNGANGAGSVAGATANSGRNLITVMQCAQQGSATMGGGGGGGGQGNTVTAFAGGSGAAGYRNGAASGAGGSTTAVSGTAGTGGNGGGGIYLIAPAITLGAASTLTVNAANGVAGTSNSGGGGGGTGGIVCLWTQSLTEVAGSTITANGGNGGGGGGAGATGGNGGTIASPVPTAGSAPTTTGGGGGGGGNGGLLIRKTGTAATDGYNSLATNTPESPGANCDDGGQKIEVGLDDGDPTGTPRDDTLQAGEVDSIFYICNGMDGDTGATGPEGPPGPIGITWQGQWMEATMYVERDAVHYAGSAWFALQDNTASPPFPGSTDWDFIANADGNIVITSTDENDFNGLGLDGFIFLLFWIAVLLFSTYMGWLVMAGFAIPGLLTTIIPALATTLDSLGITFTSLLVLVIFGFLAEVAANRFSWGGYTSGSRRLRPKQGT